ncbi:hypothetical protein C9439_03785 [archaeon SCG-AAA382B04]|nr:hypothetical protein C9439_03785 [archaeon SCG-AAA382B04]
MSTCRRTGNIIKFNTNGMLFDEEIMEKAIEEKGYSIAFSMDGATPLTNNSIRKGSKMNYVLDTINKIQNKKETKNSQLLKLEVVFVGMSRNIEELL